MISKDRVRGCECSVWLEKSKGQTSCNSRIPYFLNEPFQASFSLFSSFQQWLVNMFIIDWIRTVDLCFWNRPLYPLSHNRCSLLLKLSLFWWQSTVNSTFVHYLIFPMTGFEPRTSVFGIDRSAHWVTTAVPYCQNFPCFGDYRLKQTLS